MGLGLSVRSRRTDVAISLLWGSSIGCMAVVLIPTLRFIEAKFAKLPDSCGSQHASPESWVETTARRPMRSSVVTRWTRPSCRPGTYRNMMGNDGAGLGFDCGGQAIGQRALFLGSYPITPASEILHELSKFKTFRRSDFPGGRRNCRSDLDDWSRFWRLDGDHDVQRSRELPSRVRRSDWGSCWNCPC